MIGLRNPTFLARLEILSTLVITAYDIAAGTMSVTSTAPGTVTYWLNETPGLTSDPSVGAVATGSFAVVEGVNGINLDMSPAEGLTVYVYLRHESDALAIVTDAAGTVPAAGFDVGATLFGAAEQGDQWRFWRDFCYTETGGVYELVTTTGDAIARVLGRHNAVQINQTTAGARPLYGESGAFGWGQFDGIDDFMITSTLTPGTDKVQVFSATRKTVDTISHICSYHVNTVTDGVFFLRSTRNAGGSFDAFARGIATFTTAIGNGFLEGTDAQLTFEADLAGSMANLYMNGVLAQAKTDPLGGGNFTDRVLRVGSNNGTSNFLNGRIYDLTVRWGPNLATQTRNDMEAYQTGLIP